MIRQLFPLPFENIQFYFPSLHIISVIPDHFYMFKELSQIDRKTFAFGILIKTSTKKLMIQHSFFRFQKLFVNISVTNIHKQMNKTNCHPIKTVIKFSPEFPRSAKCKNRSVSLSKILS